MKLTNKKANEITYYVKGYDIGFNAGFFVGFVISSITFLTIIIIILI